MSTDEKISQLPSGGAAQGTTDLIPIARAPYGTTDNFTLTPQAIANLASGSGVSSIIAGSGISVDQATGDVTVSATGGGSILTARVSVSSAEILALFTSPKTLIAAPGAGKTIVMENLTLFYTYGTEVYAVAAAVSVLGALGAASINLASMLTSATQDLVFTYPTVSDFTLTGFAENAAVTLAAETSNPEDGDSTLLIDILYRIIDLP